MARQDSILRDRAIENYRLNRSSEVPRRPNALSRANRGSITWAQRGSSLSDRGNRDSRRANALQGIAVVSSRRHNEYPFIGTKLSRTLDGPTLSRAWPWYHHVSTMNIRSQGPSFQEFSTFPRSPGHCRGIITWARDKFLGTEHSSINDLTDLRGFPNVPTLSRAWPWYHHVGAMRLISFGPGQPRMAHSMLF